MNPVPKPVKPLKQKCPACSRLYLPKALLRHAEKCMKPKGKGRYGGVAQKSYAPGEKQSYPSRLERDLGVILRGTTLQVERYPSVELIPGVRWKVDFKVTDMHGRVAYHEAKGVEGERYKVLLQLWRLCGPGRLGIWKADRKGNPKLVETIIPTHRPPLEWKEFREGSEEE